MTTRMMVVHYILKPNTLRQNKRTCCSGSMMNLCNYHERILYHDHKMWKTGTHKHRQMMMNMSKQDWVNNMLKTAAQTIINTCFWGLKHRLTDASNTCSPNTCLTMERALTAGGVTRERCVLCACTHLRMNSGSVIPGKRARTPNEPYRRTHICKRRPPRESMAGDCPEPRCFSLDKWVNGASLQETRWPVRHDAVDLPTLSPSLSVDLSLCLSICLRTGAF